MTRDASNFVPVLWIPFQFLRNWCYFRSVSKEFLVEYEAMNNIFSQSSGVHTVSSICRCRETCYFRIGYDYDYTELEFSRAVSKNYILIIWLLSLWVVGVAITARSSSWLFTR